MAQPVDEAMRHHNAALFHIIGDGDSITRATLHDARRNGLGTLGMARGQQWQPLSGVRSRGFAKPVTQRTGQACRPPRSNRFRTQCFGSRCFGRAQSLDNRLRACELARMATRAMLLTLRLNARLPKSLSPLLANSCLQKINQIFRQALLVRGKQTVRSALVFDQGGLRNTRCCGPA